MPLVAWCLVRGATAYCGLSVGCGRGSALRRVKGSRAGSEASGSRSLQCLQRACIASTREWARRDGQDAASLDRRRRRGPIASHVESMALSGEGEAEMPVVVAVGVGGVRGADASTERAAGWLAGWDGWHLSRLPAQGA